MPRAEKQLLTGGSSEQEQCSSSGSPQIEVSLKPPGGSVRPATLIKNEL